MSNSQGVGKYEGDLKDGKRHGKGTLTFKDGGKYVGDWKNGKFHGKGTLTFPEGVKYFGEFGFPEGGEYVGQFKDGKMDGKGTLTFKDDSEYLEWHGGGKKDSYPTDNVQETETFGDGGKYVGQWKNGEFHGKGTLTFPDGRKYVGKFDGGFEEGDGTLSFPNGNKYVGQFHRGVEHGQGTLTFTSGNKFVGEFVYGEKWNGKMYIHNGNIHIIENGAGVETITKNQPQRSEKTSIKETSISTNEKIPPLKPTKKDKDRIFRIGCISVILIFFGYFLFDKILITTSTQEITELISKKKETWISSSLLSIFNYEWIDQLIKYQEKYGYVDSTIVRSNIALLSNFGRYAKNLCNKNIIISVKIKEWGKEIKKDVYPSYYDQEKDCKRRLRNEINKFILNGLIDERGMIEIFQETNELSMEVYFESYKNAKDLTTKRIFEKEYKKIKSEQQIFNQISIEVQLLITQYRNLVY